MTDDTFDQLRRATMRAVLGDEIPEEDWPTADVEASFEEAFAMGGFEVDVGLPQGFCQALLEEDDWSFVIKLHALVEAAFTRLLVEHFGDPGLEGTLAHLEMSNLRTGKVAFASSAGLIDPDLKRFVQKLSELRNRFVHDVSNTSMTLAEFFEGLSESDGKGYQTGFFLGHKKGQPLDFRIDEDHFSRRAITLLWMTTVWSVLPKVSIWLGAMYVLGHVYSKLQLAQLNREVANLSGELTKLLIEHANAGGRDHFDPQAPHES